MATGVNVKMGVSGIQQFKQGMKDSENAVKTLNEALKLNEAQLKATGDQELYLQNKTQILKDQISKQTEAVKQANAALEAMKKQGVDPASSSFQTMQRRAYEAQTKLVGMKTELQNVGTEAGNASTELGKIGTAVSWDNVAEGIGKINDKLEGAARAAIRFGKRIAQSAMDSTQWADDILERSVEYGIDAETLQRMDNAADFVDTSVESIIQAKDKLAKSRGSLPDLLGITTDGKSNEDLFWETGEAIKNLGDGYDQAEIAQKVFGRSWRELLPLFTTGREEYDAMLASQSVLTNEQVKSLGEADDAFKRIQNQTELMKNQFWAQNADKIVDFFQWVLDHQEEVVTALTLIGGAFAAMKMAEFGANLMKVVTGFQTLKGLSGGGAVAAAGKAAAGAAGGGVASSLSAFLTSNVGLIGTAALLGVPMADKILNGDMRSADEIERDTMQILGGQGVVDIYNKLQSQGLTKPKTSNPDWRPSYMQGQSYDNYTGPTSIGDEIIHKDRRSIQTFDQYTASLDRMAAVTEQASASEIQSNSEVAAAIGNLDGLPAAMSAAVQAGMANVTIVIGESAVRAIGQKAGKTMGNQVQAMLK